LKMLDSDSTTTSNHLYEIEFGMSEHYTLNDEP